MTSTPGDGEWLSVGDAARLLRIRPRCLRRALRKREVVGRKQWGRWYTTREQILEGARKRCIAALRQIRSPDEIINAYRNPKPSVMEEQPTHYPDEVEVVDLGEGEIPQELTALLDTKPARLYRVLPIRDEPELCTLVAADPKNMSIVDDLVLLLGKPVRFVAAHREIAKNCKLVGKLLKTYYPRDDDAEEPRPPRVEAVSAPADLDAALGEIGGLLAGQIPDVAKAPILKLLLLILVESVRRQAASIRWAIDRECWHVLYQIEDEFRPVESPPLRLYPTMLYQVKLIAGLKLDSPEPQAGEFWLVEGPPSLGWRVTTARGECVEDVTFELVYEGEGECRDG